MGDRHIVILAPTLSYSDKLNWKSQVSSVQRGGTPPHQKECHAHISVLPVNVCLSVWSIVAAAGYKANFRVLVTVIKTDSTPTRKSQTDYILGHWCPLVDRVELLQTSEFQRMSLFSDAWNLCMWQKVETCPGTRGLNPALTSSTTASLSVC